MRNTATIAALLIALGLMVVGIPVNGRLTAENFTEMDTKEIGFNPVNEATGYELEDDGISQDMNGKNATPVKPWSEQEFILPAALAFSDSTTSKKILLLSNASTETAGYTESEPAGPLDPASYSYGLWLPAVSITRHAEWRDNTLPPFGSGAEWISTQTNQEGDGDSWRLFRTGFDFPDGAVLTSAQVWFTADNTVAVYLNEDEIANAGSVYGPRPSYDPRLYRDYLTVNLSPRTGSNTLQFVVRNWVFSGDNPTGLLYKAMIEYEVPVIPNFTGRPLNGTVPLTVYFNDTSTGKPTSWNWSFGDGKFSNAQNATHTYAAAGKYTVALTASNSDWTNTTSRAGYVSVSSQGPSANFTASPTSGPAPLVVQFTDTSSGNPNPNLWSWDFGDGGLSTARNPLHTYNSEGAYTVSLTVKNKKGWDTETKGGYVMVTPATVNYYVFADGVSLYHGLDGNEDLPEASLVSQYFYDKMTTGQTRCHVDDTTGTNYCWEGIGNPVNDATGSKYWNKYELADTVGANRAEFIFHAGHGWKDGIVFGTFNNNKNVTRSEMRFSRAKWIAFDSCEFVNESRQYDWGSVFDGAHIIMGFDTWGKPHRDQGSQFVARMRGESYLVVPIRHAWKFTIQDITQDSSLKGGYVWAQPTQDDYLPGYGDFKEPVKTNGQYVINWTYFVCVPDQMG